MPPEASWVPFVVILEREGGGEKFVDGEEDG